ncbi:hypothetical protein BO70DRAFT_7893 [Aspergillus heteromorphus CBS 117.55]|uniref:JmjC domain-containing protein n=1 Tax=Aspergillus heteromorphus CBS 117.55 TaxID=1448321 RepID=A0A317X2I3_9EURO|nr:uncharacterized protein BO70DRAFT_7893 [Aspergillus heteromorphus CBS 117.55]PWY92361.1 hypothetical protein BO70DRAFT_7893 [Aspergillus heteromorphus CBS 117.55]
MRLRDLLSQTSQPSTSNPREFLYAKDLQCPREWVAALEALLPVPLRHLGSLDLFRTLPKEVAPEVLMAYVGTRKSFSGFHRCFSGTVALNLLVESEGTGSGSICFGTDRHSQVQYDAYMEELGKSPHTDWANISIAQLKSAKFPIYVTSQEPGDLVVFPSTTAHQVWNTSSMVTKVVWNLMHYSSLASFFDYVQPVYQRQCHADTGRVPLIPLYALTRGSHNAEDESLLLDVFRQLIDDEDLGTEPTVPIKHIDPQGAVVECNFCGLTIWNRHLHCEECGDFDLCLTCFVSGRSCKHVADYAWAELLSRESCSKILQETRKPPRSTLPPRPKSSQQKTLGALAVAAVDARKQSVERLCHLCRDSHSTWKGLACSQCSAFFCFRGLHRHFDVDLIPLLRKTEPWICPKCSQFCNCRCCHFPQPYNSQDKPARPRIKPVDPRGRVMGFLDNVFDQKRGKRASAVAHSASPQSGQKRPRLLVDDDKVDPTPRGAYATFVNLGASETRAPETSKTRVPDIIQSQHPADPSSSRGLGPIGQLRISDLVEKHRPGEAGHDRSPVPSLTPEDGTFRRSREAASVPPVSDDVSIVELEEKLQKLGQHANGLLELSLVESHAALLEKIAQLQRQIDKRRKAEALFDNLDRDFPDLASIAREEARRRGL